MASELGLVKKLMENTPLEMFAKGIGAGWLIAALVWIIASTDGIEFFVIGLLTYMIALFGFTHIVAASAETLYAWAMGLTTIYDVALRFFLPTLAGNVFGGSSFPRCSATPKCAKRYSKSNISRDRPNPNALSPLMKSTAL